MPNRIVQVFLAALSCIMISGCWYSFTGQSIPGVESVNISMFKDNTLELGLREKIQETLVTTFLEENIFRLENIQEADAVLKGVILKVSNPPASVDKNERTQSSEVHIEAEITLENRESGTVIVKRSVRGVGFYTNISEREAAILEAVEELALEISNAVLSGW